VFVNKTPLLKKITNSSLFIFNQKIVNDFRKELGTLCDNLFHFYHYNTVLKVSVKRKRGNKKQKSAATSSVKVAPKAGQNLPVDLVKEMEYTSPIIDLVCKHNASQK
jgi:hypothetical protein